MALWIYVSPICYRSGLGPTAYPSFDKGSRISLHHSPNVSSLQRSDKREWLRVYKPPVLYINE